MEFPVKLDPGCQLSKAPQTRVGSRRAGPATPGPDAVIDVLVKPEKIETCTGIAPVPACAAVRAACTLRVCVVGPNGLLPAAPPFAVERLNNASVLLPQM